MSETSKDFEQHVEKSGMRKITGGLNGVGVLSYPAGMKLDLGDGRQPFPCAKLAKELCDEIVFGGCIALPRQYDAHGNQLWDFRVEGGWPGGGFEGISLDSLRDLRQRVDEAIAAREAAEAAR